MYTFDFKMNFILKSAVYFKYLHALYIIVHVFKIEKKFSYANKLKL